MAEGDELKDPAVIAWHLDVIYEVLGTKKRGSVTGQGEQRWLRRLLKPASQIGRVSKVHAVKDVSFVAQRGESIGIIGHNGSGKSTLLRALAGLIPPTNGHVWLQGNPSLLGVNAVLLSQLSGERNVHIGGQALGMTPQQIADAYDDIVKLADIGEAIDRPMSTYSSGQGARLRFAISTAVKPDVLMIDEALATGDAAFRKRSNDTIAELLDGASTVFLVSHSNSAITEMCQRALWLDHGRLVMDGPAKDVVAEYAKGTVPTAGGALKPPTKVFSVPELGKHAKVVEVHDVVRPITRYIVWGPSTLSKLGQRDLDQIVEMLAPLSMAGAVSLMYRDENISQSVLESDWQVVQDQAVVLPLGGESFPVMVQQHLELLGARPEQVLLLSPDEDTVATISAAAPGIRTADPHDNEVIEQLGRIVDEADGFAGSAVDSVAALLRRDADRIRRGESSVEHLGRHGLTLTALPGFATIHLGSAVEELVNRSSRMNFTNSRFALGEAAEFLADVQRNCAHIVVGWDDFGFHSIVGFVSIDRRDGRLRHFVFADHLASLGVPEAVASFLAANNDERAIDYPVSGERPWVRFKDPNDADVVELLSTHGLASPSPDVRIIGTAEASRLALAVQPAILQAANGAVGTSLKAAAQTTFEPGANVVAYWAGQDYDDRIWGPGDHGADLYRRTIEMFLQRCADVAVVVALPAEEFIPSPARAYARPERFSEFNAFWREMVERFDHLTLVETSGVVPEAKIVNPYPMSSRMLKAWAEAVDVARGVDVAAGLRSIAGRGAQHLRLVGHVADLGELATVPLTLPHAWSDARSSTWEIEVITAPTEFSERSALLLLDADDREAVQPVPGGVSVFGNPSAQYFHYLRTGDDLTLTRFTVQGSRPFALTHLALQLWGKEPPPVSVEAVRIWVRREDDVQQDVQGGADE